MENGLAYPITFYSIWEARKWREPGAQTQNLRHGVKFGGAVVVQARAGRCRGEELSMSFIFFCIDRRNNATTLDIKFTSSEFEFEFEFELIIFLQKYSFSEMSQMKSCVKL